MKSVNLLSTIMVAMVLSFGARAEEIAPFTLPPEATRDLMPVRILGYSNAFEPSDAQGHVFSEGHGTHGWLANSEKIHFLTVRLYTQEPGPRRGSVRIAAIANSDQREGLRSLFHHYGIVMAWWGQDILTGRMTEVPAEEKNAYGPTFASLSTACADFRKRHPDFVNQKFDKAIHDLNLEEAWVSKDALLFSEASTKSEVIPQLTDREKADRQKRAAEARARFEKYQAFLLQFMSEQEFKGFEAIESRERALPAIEGLMSRGIASIRKGKVVREMTPGRRLKRVVLIQPSSESYYYDAIAEVLLKWLKREGVEVTTEVVAPDQDRF